MATAFTTTMSKEQILMAIKSIETRGASLDKNIQETALSIAAHIEQHGEVSLAIKLYNAMPLGSRRNALVQWFVTFGRVAVNQDKASKKEFPLILNKEGAVNLVEGAKKAWFDCKKEKALSEDTFTLADEVAKFQAQLQRWIKAGKVAADDAMVIDLLRIKPEVQLEGTTETVVNE